ncbi:hypothetical protein [Streptomyces sp. NBC_01429]|uniref:hypothetical protein n=1 Tax=Streptomyces sp. NBC_01429 TaxID=2903862 RepID=UPI002E27FDC4|nr:hypothetical protein [Streptomyces sp. NBC_01429]
MAWDEWEQLKAAAAERQSTHMRLNQAEGSTAGGGGADGDLKVNQADLAAVGNSAFELFEDLGRYGRDAWSSSQSAAKDLTTQGFKLGGGLHHVQEQWEKQLQSLLDACGHISNHMNFTQKTHRSDDRAVVATVSSIALLDDGFSERAQS